MEPTVTEERSEKKPKQWWLLQYRYSEDAPFGLSGRFPGWQTKRRYSDLGRARRGMARAAGDIHRALYRLEWRVLDEATGMVVDEELPL